MRDNSSAVYYTAEIREIEQLAATLPGPPALMEKAGLAAAEVAVGLAIIVMIYRNTKSTDIDVLNKLKW